MRAVTVAVMVSLAACPGAMAKERGRAEAAAHVLGYMQEQQSRLAVCVRRFPSNGAYFEQLQELSHHNAKWLGQAQQALIEEATRKGIAEPDARASIKDMVRQQERQIAYTMDGFEGGPQLYCSTQAGLARSRVGDYVPVELVAPREIEAIGRAE